MKLGVNSELIKMLSPHKVILHYWEGNLLGPTAGKLMSATLWEGLPVIISYAIIAPTQVAQIVERGKLPIW